MSCGIWSRDDHVIFLDNQCSRLVKYDEKQLCFVNRAKPKHMCHICAQELAIFHGRINNVCLELLAPTSLKAFRLLTLSLWKQYGSMVEHYHWRAEICCTKAHFTVWHPQRVPERLVHRLNFVTQMLIRELKFAQQRLILPSEIHKGFHKGSFVAEMCCTKARFARYDCLHSINCIYCMTGQAVLGRLHALSAWSVWVF